MRTVISYQFAVAHPGRRTLFTCRVAAVEACTRINHRNITTSCCRVVQTEHPLSYHPYIAIAIAPPTSHQSWAERHRDPRQDRHHCSCHKRGRLRGRLSAAAASSGTAGSAATAVQRRLAVAQRQTARRSSRAQRPLAGDATSTPWNELVTCDGRTAGGAWSVPVAKQRGASEWSSARVFGTRNDATPAAAAT